MRKGLVVAALVSLQSCAFFSPEMTVSLRLPPPPAQWTQAFPDLAYVLVLTDAEGKQRAVVAQVGARPISISCPRAANTPILAYPRRSRDPEGDDGRTFLRPAGGLYPSSMDSLCGSSTLVLKWECGPVAYVVARLLSLGRDASLLNTRRLSSLFAAIPDPWNLDLDGIADRLARGDFEQHDADLLPCRDVRITPGSGEWFLESPFSVVVASVRDGTILLPGVSLGLHALFSTDGRGALMDVRSQETCLLPMP